MRDSEALKTMLDRAGIEWEYIDREPADGLHRIVVTPGASPAPWWVFDKLGRLVRIE